MRRAKPGPEPDRRAFLAAEESFFDRFQANLNAMTGVFNPLDNRTYDASGRNRVTKTLDDRSTEVKTLIKKIAERDLMRTYEEMPKNQIRMVEVMHKEFLGARKPKVAAAAGSFSPAEELIRRGSSRRRASAGELNRFKELVVTRESVFHFLAAFSLTGWEEGCRQMLVGANYLIALCDLHHGAWRTWFAPDARWRTGARLFDLASEEEKIEAVRAFAERHQAEMLMDELTEDFVFEELGYPVPIIREAFEAIAADDRFVRLDSATRPYRLVRNYG